MTRDPDRARRYHKCYKCGTMMGCDHISGNHNCSTRYQGCGYKGPRFEVGFVTDELRPQLARFSGKSHNNLDVGTYELSHMILELKNGNQNLSNEEAVKIIKRERFKSSDEAIVR